MQHLHVQKIYMYRARHKMLQFEDNYPGWVRAAGSWRCTQELLLFPACLIKKKISSNPFLQECKGRQRKQLRLKREKKTKVEAEVAEDFWQSRSAGTCGLAADLSLLECYSLSQLPCKKGEQRNAENWISKLHQAHHI